MNDPLADQRARVAATLDKMPPWPQIWTHEGACPCPSCCMDALEKMASVLDAAPKPKRRSAA